ncbi:three-Cys-motif partner protein TcmP [Kutzneria kofuensis]|uniref:three-Cys-motif partner protein TcmP n=1 Tax=Kutzneria kofuensis TaxID=103725 RepID=UPI0031E5578E
MELATVDPAARRWADECESDVLPGTPGPGRVQARHPLPVPRGVRGQDRLARTPGGLSRRLRRPRRVRRRLPRIPLAAVREGRRSSGVPRCDGIYVERNHADFLNLQEVMARRGRPGDVVLEGDLRDLLPEIVTRCQGHALFAFLDPFGTALDRSQLVNQLLNRPGQAPTEVLLHISVTTVARIGGLLRKRREGGQQLKPAEQKTIEHADRFLGGTWWQHDFEPVEGSADRGNATEAALRVAATYQQGIRAATGCMSVSMPIRHKPNQLPKYLLVLFTRHPDGLWYFADAVGKAGREWEAAWRNTEYMQAKARVNESEQQSLFGADDLLPDPEPFDIDAYVRINRASWERIIEQNIQRLLEAEGPFVLAKRLDEVYAGVFGAADGPQVRAAVKSLHRSGVIQNTGVGDTFHRQTILPARPPSKATA